MRPEINVGKITLSLPLYYTDTTYPCPNPADIQRDSVIVLL